MAGMWLHVTRLADLRRRINAAQQADAARRAPFAAGSVAEEAARSPLQHKAAVKRCKTGRRSGRDCRVVEKLNGVTLASIVTFVAVPAKRGVTQLAIHSWKNTCLAQSALGTVFGALCEPTWHAVQWLGRGHVAAAWWATT